MSSTTRQSGPRIGRPSGPPPVPGRRTTRASPTSVDAGPNFRFCWSRTMAEFIAGVRIPDSKLAREATELLREHGTPLLFAHSLRVYLFGSLRGRHRGLKPDHELLYLGAVFHDLGLTPKYRSPDHR